MRRILSALIFLLTAPPAIAATAVVEDFDAGLGGWGPNTIETSVSHVAAGGNPGGWLLTDSFGSQQAFGAVGASNSTAPYSGGLPDGLWTVSVDLLFVTQTFDEARLRWRYSDPTYNGWYIPIETSVFAPDWTTYSIAFDTTWSDAQAMAAGWVREATSVDFSTLWDDLYTAEVRLTGSGALEAGIDNYRMQPAPVPVPAGLVLLGSALAGLSAMRRKA